MPTTVIAASATTQLRAALAEEDRQPLERLIRIAKTDTGQASTVANFLLAWWNAEDNGGFDFTEFWAVDTSVATDMFRVISLVIRSRNYPDTLGYGPDFQAIWKRWRKE